jgi:hypothetical protein
MKRDIDLMREILLASEEQAATEPLRGIPEPSARYYGKYNFDTVAYNVYLLIDGGLVQGHADRLDNGSYSNWIVERLTMAGHDLLDIIRDDGIFSATKERLKSIGGTASLEVWKGAAIAVAKDRLGLL